MGAVDPVIGGATLPELSDYSADELNKIRSSSPVFDQYLRIVDRRPEDVIDRLRHKRIQQWLRAAAAALTDKASSATVCRFWSEVSEDLLIELWNHCFEPNSGAALVAFGKLGASELNLSSDVDLCFYTEDAPTEEHFRSTRRFIQLASEHTEFGFLFRVDPDLRPGGRMAPLVASLKQLQDYYWSSGATWERLALTRARFLAGSTKVRDEFATLVSKYCYRKYLDFSLLEDLRQLRSQIHRHVRPVEESSMNLKLCPGGIRDIELFLHALLIIHGGRNTNLRVQSTTAAAQLIGRNKVFDSTLTEQLLDDYWFFRDLENKAQAAGDQQTHLWRAQDSEKLFLEAKVRAKRVDELVASVVGRAENSELPMDDEGQQTWLQNLGFSKMIISEIWPTLLNSTAVSEKSAQDERTRLLALKIFMEEISRNSLDKDLAARLLLDFFKSVRAKASFFSLLVHEPRLITDLSFLFGTSPYLGFVVSSRPEILDRLVYQGLPAPAEDWGVFLQNLADQKLVSEIVAGVGLLRNRDIDAFSESLTKTADEIALRLLDKLSSELGSQAIDIIALGKWGGRELGLRSDLDFIFVTDSPPTEIDQKVTRRFLTRITEQNRGGSLYLIDLRLRPSGKSGPILVQKSELVRYLNNEASPWELQSYLKARSLRNLELNLDKTICTREISQSELVDLKKIRDQLMRHPAQGLDIKFQAGGLIDIEFSAQIALIQKKVRSTGPSTAALIGTLTTNAQEWSQGGPTLLACYRSLRLAEQMRQLVGDTAGTTLSAVDSASVRLAKFEGKAPEILIEHLRSILFSSDAILQSLDPRRQAN